MSTSTESNKTSGGDSTNISESLLEEMGRRAADQSPGWLLPRLLAVQNLRRLWAEQDWKREHDHKRERRLLGDPESEIASDAMNGDFSIHIAGDSEKRDSLKKRNGLPLALAVAIPVTAGLLMLPQILEAMKDKPAEVVAEEFQPILLPGKP